MSSESGKDFATNCATDVTGCTDEDFAAAFAPVRETIQKVRDLGLLPAERAKPPLSALQWAIIDQMWEREMWGGHFHARALMRDHYGIQPFAKQESYKEWRREYRCAHIAICRAVKRLQDKDIVGEGGRLTEEVRKFLVEKRCRVEVAAA
jgi:hypothetical protein